MRVLDGWRTQVALGRSLDVYDTLASASTFSTLGAIQTKQTQLAWENRVALPLGEALAVMGAMALLLGVRLRKPGVYTLNRLYDLALSRLSAGVAARIPARCNGDDRYFSDRWQAMPADGYSAMFERMLNHPNIHLRLGTGFEGVRGRGWRRTRSTPGP